MIVCLLVFVIVLVWVFLTIWHFSCILAFIYVHSFFLCIDSCSNLTVNKDVKLVRENTDRNVVINRIVRSYEPGTLRLSNHADAEHPFGVPFASFWSDWAATKKLCLCMQKVLNIQKIQEKWLGIPQRVDCLARMVNKSKVSFPR